MPVDDPYSSRHEGYQERFSGVRADCHRRDLLAGMVPGHARLEHVSGDYTNGALNSVTGGAYSNTAATIDVSILGNKIRGMTIDTGSTGIAISANFLPSLAGYTPLGPGTINYDSSGVSPSGTFYELPVNLLSGNTVAGSTTVKVLVVTNDTVTRYFGIGNNRTNVYSGAINPSL
jgi:hypothetical protein